MIEILETNTTKLPILRWDITKYCNYDCSYCYSNNNGNVLTLDSIKFTLSKLKKIDFEFIIEILGGEPTTHPNFDYLLEELNNIKYCKVINIVTNFSKDFNKINSDKINTIISYHFEYETITFRNRIIDYIENNKNVQIIIAYDDRFYDKFINLLEFINDNKLQKYFSINRLMNTPNKPNFRKSFEKLNKLSDNIDFSFLENNIKYTVNKNKEIDINYLFQNYSFKGYTCYPRIIEIKDTYFEVYCTNEKFVLLTKKKLDSIKTICEFDRCVCPQLMYSRKVK